MILNWLLEGLFVNFFWSSIVWFTKPIKKDIIKQININAIKKYLYLRITIFMSFSLALPSLLLNLLSKDIVSILISIFTIINFFAILFQFLSDFNSFLENVTIKKKNKCPK